MIAYTKPCCWYFDEKFQEMFAMFFFATLTGHHVQLELAAELGYITMSKFLYAHRLMFRKCISSGVCILVAYYYFLRVLCVALHGDDSFTAPLNRFQFAKMWCERMFNTKNILISFLLPFRVVFLKGGSNLDPPHPALGTRPAKQGGSMCGGVLPPNESFRRFLGFGLGVG